MDMQIDRESWHRTLACRCWSNVANVTAADTDVRYWAILASSSSFAQGN